MEHALWLEKQAKLSLERLMSRLDPLLKGKKGGKTFKTRLKAQFPAIFRLLHSLYGDQYDFFYHLEQILTTAARMSLQRPADLKTLDEQREDDPYWFQSEQMVGGVCYVDLFAGDLTGLQQKIPYLKELGLTYLHLMPLFKTPEGNSDGGYAVSDYREIAPHLGTMKQLNTLSAALRKEGISLVVDLVFNHTANDHTWAKKALAGDETYQNYYFMFDDRTLPGQYERHLRDIFPEQDPGSFTYLPRLDKWVWTTFNHFQWDLNYHNPAVFNAMLEELLFLANQGVEILRLDAVAFIWKQMGTTCESLPQAHTIIQAFNALVRVAAPALLFKSEAIVHPDEVASYISWEECPISYNPTLMALLWESLATREVRLLRHSMHRRFAMPENCAWVNYVRCHDDIGWTFADEDAAELGVNGFDHRQFLNRFYTGRFPGSHATGLPFNYNPVNQDMRIAGMTASLAGLEQALDWHNARHLEYSTARILLIHSVIMSVGGIPLLYLGDEIAMTNDYSYQDDETKKNDSRWAHRPQFDWEKAQKRSDITTIEGRVFQGLQRLIQTRKQTPALAQGETIFFDTGNPHVLGYICDKAVLVLANFSENEQIIRGAGLGYYGWLPDEAKSLLNGGETVSLKGDIQLKPYQFYWLGLDKA